MNFKKPIKLEVPVRIVRQPIGDFFTASVDARTLVDISYSDIRRLEQRDIEKYLGIQRPLDQSRVKKIQQYLQGRDATFPTAIIIAVDENCATYDDKKEILTLTPYEPNDEDDAPIEYNKIAKILDGQHRLAGFLDDSDNRVFNFQGQFDLNVSIFVGIDISEQAKIFATVNLAQTKVNKSLVYDLEELAKKRSPFKSCHEIAVALDRNEGSPFYHRIKRLGVATPGRDYEPLTQAAFVESLVKLISDDPTKDRNDILNGTKIKEIESPNFPFRSFFKKGQKGDLLVYDIIYNYFSAVKEKWPQAWENKNQKGNLLPRSNAFKALMKYLRYDVCPKLISESDEKAPSIKKFLKEFDHVELKDSDFITKNFVPGSGGQSTFYKVLTGEKKAQDLLE